MIDPGSEPEPDTPSRGVAGLAGAHPVLAAVLGLCLAIDVAVLVLCPILGGDCLYGFFSLIVFPVILSGPLGLLIPRHAPRISALLGTLAPAWLGTAWTGGWLGLAAVWVAGAVALGLVIALAHVAAILVLNWWDYGGAPIRPRLLQVELGLATVYYVALGAIAYAAASGRET